MINLLPAHDKTLLRAGRANWLLVRYVAGTGGVIAITVLLLGATWMFLVSVEANANKRIEENTQAVNALAAEMQDVREFEQNLGVAKQILEKEVNYSAIILRYASVIPGDTIIESLTLDPSVIGQPSSFTAKAKSEAAVLRFKDALANSPYFSDVRFSDITYEESSEEYPYTIAITLQINQDLLAAEAEESR